MNGYVTPSKAVSKPGRYVRPKRSPSRSSNCASLVSALVYECGHVTDLAIAANVAPSPPKRSTQSVRSKPVETKTPVQNNELWNTGGSSSVIAAGSSASLDPGDWFPRVQDWLPISKTVDGCAGGILGVVSSASPQSNVLVHPGNAARNGRLNRVCRSAHVIVNARPDVCSTWGNARALHSPDEFP